MIPDRLILVSLRLLRRLAAGLRSLEALEEERLILDALCEEEGILGSEYEAMLRDLAGAQAVAAELAQRSPDARIGVLFGEPEPWRLADTEGRAIVRGRRLADVLPPRTTSGPRVAGVLLAVSLALVTACHREPAPPPLFPYEQAQAEASCNGAGGPVQVIDAPGLVALDGAPAHPQTSTDLAASVHLFQAYTHRALFVRRGALVLTGGAIVRCVVCSDGARLVIEQGSFLRAVGCEVDHAATFSGWPPGAQAAPIPPAPTPWALYGAAMVAGGAAGYSLVRLRRG